MRFLRSLLIFQAGAYAGFAAAAGVMKQALPSRGDEESDELALVTIFEGKELKSRATSFRGGSMLAWFGGIAVDLRDAQLAQDAHLTLNAMFGGIAVRIPEGWRVESKAKALAGGIDVRTRGADDPSAPTLTIDGLALFGGIAVGAKGSAPES
ncbi:MAG TPA: LiaF domain-containing protein [Gaiellaceae bacterium]|nr:LiaF domain-containing protein [Gaiellaceae bacterium]